jgi:hypothetical protein
MIDGDGERAERLTQTLAGIASRAREGEDFQHAVREFLDAFTLGEGGRSCVIAIEERPELTGDIRQDAYLGALAEHLALSYDLPRPPWSIEPNRFLDRFWFISDVPGLRAISIAQTPPAFKRRGIFVPRRSLKRV